MEESSKEKTTWKDITRFMKVREKSIFANHAVKAVQPNMHIEHIGTEHIKMCLSSIQQKSLLLKIQMVHQKHHFFANTVEKVSSEREIWKVIWKHTVFFKNNSTVTCATKFFYTFRILEYTKNHMQVALKIVYIRTHFDILKRK